MQILPKGFGRRGISTQKKGGKKAKQEAKKGIIEYLSRIEGFRYKQEKSSCRNGDEKIDEKPYAFLGKKQKKQTKRAGEEARQTTAHRKNIGCLRLGKGNEHYLKSRFSRETASIFSL